MHRLNLLMRTGVLVAVIWLAGCHTDDSANSPVRDAPPNDAAIRESSTEEKHGAIRQEEPFAAAAPAEADAANDSLQGDVAAKTMNPAENNSQQEEEATEVAQDQPATDAATADELLVQETAKAIPSERLVLFAPGGPVLVELVMTVDGTAPKTLIESLIDTVLAADQASPGSLVDWNEFTRRPSIAAGTFGNAVINSDGQRYQIIQDYDINRNGKVERTEIPGFLLQNVGSSHVFSIAQDDSQSNPESQLLRWCDTNQDGQLDDKELASMTVRLLQLDQDDDRSVTADEVQRLQVGQNRMNQNRRNYLRPELAYLITDFTDWPNLLYRIQEAYSYGRPLLPDDFPSRPDLFSQWDTNQDQQINPDEIQVLQTCPPDVQLSIRFVDSNQLVAVEAICELADANVVSLRSNETLIELPELSLRCFAESNLSANTNLVAERIVAAADLNSDELLAIEEYAGVPGTENLAFQVADANQNGEVSIEELQQVLASRQLSERCRVAGRLRASGDFLFERLDENRDGQLSEKELQHVAARVADLLQSRDSLSAESAATNLNLILQHGGVASAISVDSRRFTQNGDQPSAGPVWFVQMDRNADAEVSRQEFLGTEEQFRSLDQDADGFVSAKEAADLEKPKSAKE
ncbi:MAG: EF-hand domain-containing protein [Pirellulaceae bacterium]